MATYYVDPVSGNNGNAGTSFGAAWATTQKAADTAVAGDTVYLCATGDESIAAKIDMDTNAGTAITLIRFIGANSSGIVDGTSYVIKATAAITAILDYTATADYTYWENVTFNGNANATYCVYNNVDGSDIHTFVNCIVKSATSHGVYVRGTGDPQWMFFGCRFTVNGGAATNHSAGNRGRMLLSHCIIDNNTGGGIISDVNVVVIQNCIVYRNTGIGVDMGSNSNWTRIIGCTVYANTTVGIRLYNATSRAGYVIHNTTVSANGTYGIAFQTGNQYTAIFCDYNHAYGNSSGATDLSGNLLPGTHNNTADPKFVNTGVGTEDFSLQATSPLIAAGLGGITIGAKDIHSVSGGGLLTHPGMSGGMRG